MLTEQSPQICIALPASFDVASKMDSFKGVLDAVDIACVRMAAPSADIAKVSKAAEAIRRETESGEIPLLIEEHYKLVEPLGLDGVHLGNGRNSVRKSKAALGASKTVGAFCGTTRHEGLSAAEAGCDYVSFGPVSASWQGDGDLAAPDLFAWWSEMTVIPVVAEGALNRGIIAELAPHVDFLYVSEIWDRDDPAAALLEMLEGID
ncbi:MAG: thiamine phosphate synthase [Albidovulum sp.]|nr:thiamine phosphate synthase [Albidovulum sp.]